MEYELKFVAPEAPKSAPYTALEQMEHLAKLDQ
jgi:hypothetical protein